MSEITGTIDYVLNIDPTGQKHTLDVPNTIEGDIVALMMAATTLTHKLHQQKELKKTLSGPNKRAVSENIANISAALRGLKPVMDSLCDAYYPYKQHQEELLNQQKAEDLTEQGILPKQDSEEPSQI